MFDFYINSDKTGALIDNFQSYEEDIIDDLKEIMGTVKIIGSSWKGSSYNSFHSSTQNYVNNINERLGEYYGQYKECFEKVKQLAFDITEYVNNELSKL